MIVRAVAIVLGVSLAVLAGAAATARAEWRFTPATGKWVRTPAKDMDTEVSDNQLQRAIAAFEKPDWKEAERQGAAWLRFYRYNRDAQAAMFLVGEARRCQGDYDGAFEAFELLLDGYAGTDLFDATLAREIEMADAFLKGKKRLVLRMFWVTAYDEGETMLEKVFQRDPRGKRGKAAEVMLADYHFREGRFGEAEDEYQRLASNFPNDADAAHFKLQAAQAALGRFPGTKHDARALDEARQQFKQFQNEHPKEAEAAQVPLVLDGIKERQAEKDFQNAEFYKAKQPKAAMAYYRFIMRDYPGTLWATRARAELVAMGVEPANESTAPPKVLAAGVAAKGADGEPDFTAGADGRPGPATQPADAGGEVITSGPAPVARAVGESGVIDIGPPTDDNEAPKLVRSPGRVPPAASQPESANGG